MELKVWVEGIQRIVCGVTETTTCQDVVFALAHATGKVGRFTLIERWRNNERLLAPQEFPLKILMKWGEYSNDIQFILRRSDSHNQKPTQVQTNQSRSPIANGGQNNSNPNILDSHSPPSHSNPMPTHQVHQNNNSPGTGVGTAPGYPVGVVKGIPQSRTPDTRTPDSDYAMKDVPPYRDPPPPYRSPPPPAQALRKSPNHQSPHQNNQSPYQNHQFPQQNYHQSPNHPIPMSPVNVPEEPRSPEAVAFNNQYKELVTLVNSQREKLTSQQTDLIKFDAEIGYWESKGREQERQGALLQQQLGAADTQLRAGAEQIQTLSYVEEESEAVQQHEQALRAELALVRSKLAACEAELQQCRAQLRLLLEELHEAQRAGGATQQENRQALERSLVAGVEGLQARLQRARRASEANHLAADALKQEVGVLENAIMEKKRQVEQLVAEMKEANLQSLGGDELRPPPDGGGNKASARRIIGSPRQLENAAPTNKNPHGVWV